MFLRGLCILGIIITQFILAEPLPISVNAEAAILMNAETGQILFEKNARSLQYPASITKIATALYALKMKGNQLDTKIVAEQESVASIAEEAKRRAQYTLPAYWLVPGGSHIGIKKGEVLTLNDLLHGMMVASGNDASNVIAQHIGGTIPEFMNQLNAYLKDIGCGQTTFYNPHGLHHPMHQTTAYDMALITREALKNATFRQIVSSVRYTRPKTNKQEPATLIQSNRLLRSGKYYYQKAIGVKTGYTSIALSTFVGAAKHNERTLICVLLKTKEREDMFKDCIKMFETAFNQPKVQRTLLKTGPQKFTLEVKGAVSPVKTYIQNNVFIDYYPAEEPKLKCFLTWDVVAPPIKKDQRVGELTIKNNEGQALQKVPLFAQEEVPSTWIYWLQHLF